MLPILRFQVLTLLLLALPGAAHADRRRRHHARHILMAGQVALALALLVSSGLMVRSFQKLRAVDPGFNPASTLAFSVGLPDREYRTRAAAAIVHDHQRNRSRPARHAVRRGRAGPDQRLAGHGRPRNVPQDHPP